MRKVLFMLVGMLLALSATAQGISPQKDAKKNLWGYVDGSGKWVVKPNFDSASEFATQPNGKRRAIVESKGLKGFIDETGKPLGAGIVFEGIEPMQGDAISVTVKGKKGVANYDGVYIVKPEYDVIYMCLDGAVYIGEVKDKYDVINGKTGKRRRRFEGLTGISAYEFPDKGAMLLYPSNGKTFIYTKDIDVVNKIGVKTEGVYDFYRVNIFLPEDGYYTSEDKKSIEPYLQSGGNYFSPDGKETEYVKGGHLKKDLFYMTTGDGRVDLYKYKEDGSTQLGSLEREPYKNESWPTFFTLNGQCITDNGDPITLFSVPGWAVSPNNFVYYKNERTGKYGLHYAKHIYENEFGIKDANNQTDYEIFDRIDISKDYRSLPNDDYGMLLYKDGTVYYSDGRFINGKITGNGTLDINTSNGFTTFVNAEGKLGLKKGGKVVLNPEYSGIYTLKQFNSKENWETDYLKLYKDGKCALYNKETEKFVIPFEKGYTSIGGRKKSLNVPTALFNSGLCYVQVGEDDAPGTTLGMWNLRSGKEVVAPSKDNNFDVLPVGYPGYRNKGVTYTPDGNVMKLAPAVDVYQSDWANNAPYYLIKLAGLKDRTIQFQMTVYNENGSVYTGRHGGKCIYTFSQTVTPETVIEYGPEITFYLGDDIYIPPYTRKTLKFVLSAKDAKTGAAIPVKGEKSYGRWYERTW